MRSDDEQQWFLEHGRFGERAPGTRSANFRKLILLVGVLAIVLSLLLFLALGALSLNLDSGPKVLMAAILSGLLGIICGIVSLLAYLYARWKRPSR